jgi:hypothetical protein
MPSLKAAFDGHVFVPSEKVDLPPGTVVEVLVPRAIRRPSAAEEQQWQDVLGDLAKSAPEYPTVDEAIRVSRGRP